MMVFKRRQLESGVSQLPEEILQEILLRLPIKSLCKFRAVCKSWNSFILTSDFIHTHLSRTVQSHNQNQILLIQAPAEVEIGGKSMMFYDQLSLHWDNPPFDEYTNCKLRNPFIACNTHAISPKMGLHQYGRVVGTCNGLVCLEAYDHTVLIWNPCVRKFVILPRPPNIINGCRSYFGYDSPTNDYKVLRFVSYREDKKTSWEIWSLAQPSWRSLSVVLPVDDFRAHGHTAFVRGAVHWVHEVKHKAYSIVSFDMSSELFGEMMILPEALRKEEVYILKHGYSLAFIDKTVKGPQVDMWVMKEYGVAESCAKLLATKMPPPNLFRVLGFRNSGEAVVSNPRWQKFLNPKTNEIGDFPTNGYCDFVQPFVESLVLLDQPNAISS
jgi:F-box interacting protein